MIGGFGENYRNWLHAETITSVLLPHSSFSPSSCAHTLEWLIKLSDSAYMSTRNYFIASAKPTTSASIRQCAAWKHPSSRRRATAKNFSTMQAKRLTHSTPHLSSNFFSLFSAFVITFKRKICKLNKMEKFFPSSCVLALFSALFSSFLF
jgi:hypothetical protein